MKKKILLIFFFFIPPVFLFAILNTTVTTQQGIDGRVSTIELPLFNKIFNFYYRHFNYKWLAKRITDNLETNEEKIFRLFQWTHEAIRHQPENLPVRDDHVWNVYVRGYGVNENFHDLFSTLCNYIGVDAFFVRPDHKPIGKNKSKSRSLSVVKIKRGWVVFDPFHGIYFINKNGDWATVKEIKNQNWKLKKLAPTNISGSYYKPYLEAIPVIKAVGLKRANIQSPTNRIRFELERLFSE